MSRNLWYGTDDYKASLKRQRENDEVLLERFVYFLIEKNKKLEDENKRLRGDEEYDDFYIEISE